MWVRWEVKKKQPPTNEVFSLFLTVNRTLDKSNRGNIIGLSSLVCGFCSSLCVYSFLSISLPFSFVYIRRRKILYSISVPELLRDPMWEDMLKESKTVSERKATLATISIFHNNVL